MIHKMYVIPLLSVSILLLCVTMGCASSERAVGSDVTGGLTLEMFIENPGDSYAVYRVDEDGVLSFAGGVDAHDRKYTWSGPMTSEEIDRLHALLDEHRWFESGPKSSGTPPGRRYEIELSKPGVVRDFAVLGDGPSISPIFDLLETAARRRHEQFMQTLPKPGQQE